MSRQARSLDVLLAEVNQHAPRRSKASDGGLGDPAHAARVSDHNPNKAGVWRARDFTDDPPRFSADDFARRVAAMLGKHPALGPGAYVIWRRRIISTSRLAEGWRPYSGANPHNKHAHVSVATDAAGYDSTRPWGIYQEDDMNAAQEAKLDKALEVARSAEKAAGNADTWARSARTQALAAHRAALELQEMVRQLARTSGVEIDAAEIADRVSATLADDVADTLAARLKE